jgi:hypothetical protein
VEIYKMESQVNILSGEVGKLARMQVKLVGVSVRGHVIRNDIHTGHLMFFFPLHPPILKPDLYLSFGQAQGVCYLYSPPPRQVPIEVEFFF